MSNELLIDYTSGNTLYALLFDSIGRIWNGASFVEPAAAVWTDCDIVMSEVVATSGLYRGTMPTIDAGLYSLVGRKQAGVAPAVTDMTVGVGRVEWSGTAEVTLTSRASQISVDDVPTNAELATALATADDATLVAIAALNNLSSAQAQAAATAALNVYDPPTNAEMEARTLATAGYFDPTTDTVTLANNGITAAKFASDAIAEIAAATAAVIDTSRLTVVSAIDGDVITLYQAVTFAATIGGLAIPVGWTKLWFTVKQDLEQADVDAIVQIVETNPHVGTDGLLRLNGAAGTAANGELAVNQLAGTVIIGMAAASADNLALVTGLAWSAKALEASGTITLLAVGMFNVLGQATTAIV